MQQMSSPASVSTELVKTDGWALLQHLLLVRGAGTGRRTPRTGEFPVRLGLGGAQQCSSPQPRLSDSPLWSHFPVRPLSPTRPPCACCGPVLANPRHPLLTPIQFCLGSAHRFALKPTLGRDGSPSLRDVPTRRTEDQTVKTVAKRKDKLETAISRGRRGREK